MIRVFLSGFSFGMLLQLAVGPVCLSVLNRSAACGRLEGCKMACGVVLADATYIVLAAAGAAQLLSVLLLRRILLVAGAAIIFGFGLASIRAKADDHYVQSPAGSFLFGYKLTLANPLTIVFWTGTFGSLLATGKITAQSLPVFAIGCLTATWSFLSVVSVAGSLMMQHLGERATGLLQKAVGIFLMAFALKLFFM